MRRRDFLGAFGAAAGTLLHSTAHAAERRSALVIGNSAYQHLPALKTPLNDAQAIGQVLTRANFTVASGMNLTLAGMRQGLRQFASAFAAGGPDAVGLLFYAGHGLQVEEDYYLLPVDIQLRARPDLTAQTLPFTELISALPTARNRILIIILDASRSNPYAPGRKAPRIVDAPVGTIVAYATSPGQDLIENEGPHSFYTKALLEVMREPGLAIELVFKKARIRVNELSKRQQIPAETSSLRTNFSLFPTAGRR